MRSSVPLYHHLKAQLIKRIEHGLWKAGERIPSETQLMQEFSISRTTVRQALGDLVSLGHLVRKQGRGTYVSNYAPMEAASPLYGFAEELRRKGLSVSVHERQVRMVECPQFVADSLRLAPGKQVLFISRLVKHDGTPIFQEHSYFVVPFHLSESTMIHPDTVFDAVYAFFEKYGVKISRGRQRIQAEKASHEDARLLEVKLGEPVLVIRRVTHDETGSPVEYAEVRYAAERYQYEVDLRRMIGRS